MVPKNEKTVMSMSEVHVHYNDINSKSAHTGGILYTLYCTILAF